MKKVCIVGFGKLGQSIYKSINRYKDICVNTIIDIKNKENTIKEISIKDINMKENLFFYNSLNEIEDNSNFDIIIDSTVRDAFISNIDIYTKLKKPLIIATTNIDDQYEKLKELSKCVPIVKEPNYDFELINFRNIIKEVYSTFSNMLPSITEVHHTQKIDVSGTAKSLVNDLLSVKDKDKRNDLGNATSTDVFITSTLISKYDNESILINYKINNTHKHALTEIIKKYISNCKEINEIPKEFDTDSFEASSFNTDYNEINIKSIRYGNVVGIHKVTFLNGNNNNNNNEFISITHNVISRNVFADGIAFIANSINRYTNGIHSINEFSEIYNQTKNKES